MKMAFKYRAFYPEIRTTKAIIFVSLIQLISMIKCVLAEVDISFDLTQAIGMIINGSSYEFLSSFVIADIFYSNYNTFRIITSTL